MRMPWIALGALLLTGCAGAESDFLNDRADAPVATLVVTTVPPASTTTVAVTVAPTTAPPTTFAPTTTIPETTTTLSLEDQVRTGWAIIWANRDVCMIAPATCDVSTVAELDSPEYQYLEKR